MAYVKTYILDMLKYWKNFIYSIVFPYISDKLSRSNLGSWFFRRFLFYWHWCITFEFFIVVLNFLRCYNHLYFLLFFLFYLFFFHLRLFCLRLNWIFFRLQNLWFSYRLGFLLYFSWFFEILFFVFVFLRLHSFFVGLHMFLLSWLFNIFRFKLFSGSFFLQRYLRLYFFLTAFNALLFLLLCDMRRTFFWLLWRFLLRRLFFFILFWLLWFLCGFLWWINRLFTLFPILFLGFFLLLRD